MNNIFHEGLQGQIHSLESEPNVRISWGCWSRGYMVNASPKPEQMQDHKKDQGEELINVNLTKGAESP